MADLVNHFDLMNFANRFRLEIVHFARGVYPEAFGVWESLPRNRFFMPIGNPSGAACFIADEKYHYELKPGRAYFIPCFHDARVKLDEHLLFLSIQFHLNLYEGVDLLSHGSEIMEFENPEYLRRGLAAFEDPDRFTASMMLQGIVFDFCADVIRRMSPDDLAFAVNFSDFQKELDFLKDHTLATTTVETLADLRSIRREVFTRKFTAATGMPPKKFLTRILLSRACSMLLQSTVPVREIAENLAFTNEYYFSRFFKKQTGIPPKRFREFYTHGENREIITK